MGVTLDMIATGLGRTAPPIPSLEADQWQMWINDALMLISARLGDLSDPSINQAALDYVVREAVVAHIRRPDDAASVDVRVDDGQVSKTYRTASGRVTILDEWWGLLVPKTSSRAFSFRPQGRCVLHADICTINLGADWCSCGADLNWIGDIPLFEVGY